MPYLNNANAVMNALVLNQPISCQTSHYYFERSSNINISLIPPISAFKQSILIPIRL